MFLGVRTLRDYLLYMQNTELMDTVVGMISENDGVLKEVVYKSLGSFYEEVINHDGSLTKDLFIRYNESDGEIEGVKLSDFNAYGIDLMSFTDLFGGVLLWHENFYTVTGLFNIIQELTTYGYTSAKRDALVSDLRGLSND